MINEINNGNSGLQVLTNLLVDMSNEAIISASSLLKLNASQIACMLSAKGMDKAQIATVLGLKKFDAETVKLALSLLGLQGAELDAAMANYNLAASSGIATGGLTALWASIKKVTGALITFLTTTPVGWATLAVSAIAAVIGVVNAYNEHIEELVEKAHEAASAYSEVSDSMDSYRAQIKDLRTELEDETLSEEEAYRVKTELLQVQTELTDSYGNQADGIDLVNGELEEQLQLLRDIEIEEAGRYLTEHADAIEIATEKMTSRIGIGVDGAAYLGSYNTLSEESSLLDELFDKYEEYIEFGETDNNTATREVYFYGNPEDADKVLSDLMTDYRKISKMVEDETLVVDLEFNTKQYLDQAQETISEYQEIYEKSMRANLIEDTDEYTFGGKEQTAYDWLIEYTQAVEDYNLALLNGDPAEIATAAQNFADVDDAIKSLTGENGDLYQFLGLFEEIEEQLNTTAIAQSELISAFENGNQIGDINVKSLAEELGNLSLSDVDLKLALITDNDQTGEKQLRELIDAAEQLGFVTGDSVEEIQPLIDLLIELGYISGITSSGFAGDLQQIQDALDLATEKSNEFLSEFQSATEIINAQSTGRSISLADYNSDALKDYTSALEYNNGALQLNAEKVNDLIKAKAEEQIAYNNTQKAVAQSEYIKNAREIKELRNEIEELEKTGSALTKEQQEFIDKNKQAIKSYEAQNASILDTCTQYNLMSAAIREATGEYQHWLNAQEAAQSGDMFDSVLTAMNRVDETLNDTESEFFGRVGRTDYTAALDVIIPDHIDKEDQDAVNAYLEQIGELFMFDEDGNYAGLNLDAFVQKAVDEGLMKLDESGKNYVLAGEMTMESFAEGMELALPLVQAMFGEMGEFGGKFDWLDYGNKTLGDFAIAAQNAADSLGDDFDYNLDFSSFEEPLTQIPTVLQGAIALRNQLADEPLVNTQSVAEANDIIQYCVLYLQALEDPAILRVDTSQLSGEAAEAVKLLQDYKNTYNAYQLQLKVGADTTQIEEELNRLLTEIAAKSVKGGNAYLIGLGLNTNTTDDLNSQITKLKVEELDGSLKIGDVNFSSEYSTAGAFDQTGTLTMKVDDSEVVAFQKGLGNITRYVTYRVKSSASDASTGAGKGGLVNGTAHTFGTAYAGGNWGTAPGGKTLVGELGQEIVVNPRTGRWYTVGDNGAEFRNIPNGAIVFNHIQTEHLLRNGYVASRASALVRGTAMLGGTAMALSGLAAKSVKIFEDGPKRNLRTKKEVDSGKSSSGSTSNSGSSTSSKELKVFDWIEVAIDRISEAVKRLTDIASSAYKSIKTKLGASSDAISKVNEQISLQQDAYDKYMQKANSVKLSSDLKKKVQSGSINISEYDSDTQDLIKQYQEWYDKAQDCSSAVDELHEQLADLYSERFDAIQEDYNNQLEELEHLTAMYESELNTGSNDSDTFSKLRDVETQKIALLTEELKALEKAFEDAMASGLIEVGSDAWYEMRNEIHGVNEELVSVKENLVNLYMDEFEEIQDDFDNQMDMLDHSATRLENEIELLEAKGYSATKEQYEALQDVERKRIDLLKQELSDLERTIEDAVASGKIKEGDDAWYEMQSSIEDVKEEIQEANIALEEYNQTMKELDWEAFDKQQEAISDTIAETDYQLDLIGDDDLVDENGNITAAGSQASSLHSQNFDSYMQQANAYAEEIQRIDAELANDPNNEKLLERRKELLELQRESVLAAEDEKQAIEDLNEEAAELRAEAMQDAMEKRAEAAKEALQDQLDAMKELIDSYTEALDRAKDLHDYRKKVADQTEKIANIEKQLSAYEGDDSEEMRATVQKLKDDLETAQEDLKETEYDKYVSDRKQMLDDMYSQYEENINQRIDAIDASLENMNGSITTGFDSMIGAFGTSSNELGSWITGDMHTAADTISGILSGYGDGTIEQISSSNSLLEQIREYVAEMLHIAGTKAQEVQTSQDVTQIDGVTAYSTGGLVDYDGLAMVHGAKKPELVLNAQDTENFLALKEALVNSYGKITYGTNDAYSVGQIIPHIDGLANLSALTSSIYDRANTDFANQFGDIQITIPIEHVQDYNDFVKQLRNDRQFEKIVQAVTTERLANKGNLLKYKQNL